MISNKFPNSGGQQTKENTSIGWQLDASITPQQIHGMTNPQTYPVPFSGKQNESDANRHTVVEENFKSKDAGAMSFAHYITRWVRTINKNNQALSMQVHFNS